MSGKKGSQSFATMAAIGPQIDNGYEMGGARVYPYSTGLALMPPAYYSDYIGVSGGFPQVAVPAGALPDTIGTSGTGEVPSSAAVEASAHPWGRTSPLPWVIVGLGALIAVHHLHYSDRK